MAAHARCDERSCTDRGRQPSMSKENQSHSHWHRRCVRLVRWCGIGFQPVGLNSKAGSAEASATNLYENAKEWIDIDTKGTLSDFAYASVDLRLKRVCRLLPLAASHAKDDIEHVHQLRIATRQAFAALDTFEMLLVKKDKTWLRKQMKEIRSAAGGARDLDVMLNRFQGPDNASPRYLVRFLRKQRKAAQRPLIKLDARLNRRTEFEVRIAKCLSVAATASDDQVLALAIERMREAVQSFVLSRPKAAHDVAALHHLRVQAKQLRYTLEIFSELGCTGFMTELYPLICEVQQQLGKLNDHVVAASRLTQLACKAEAKKCAALLNKLSEKEETKARKIGKRFLRWWTDERSARVKAAFDECSSAMDASQAVTP